jgi:hypothetical protein
MKMNSLKKVKKKKMLSNSTSAMKFTSPAPKWHLWCASSVD